KQEIFEGQNRHHVAVATYEGMLVNQHLGEAKTLYVFEQTKNGYKLIEQRPTPEPGKGDFRWIELSKTFADCRAILTGGAGKNPTEVLQSSGIQVIQMTGLIDTGLDAVYKNTPLRTLKKSDMMKCGESCRGDAQGCA
ncbi:MAG: NifB/NifX family molybdenum-iron cluster-binding protein, partial [Bacteroidales bacterium]|nr:NifB/NifX family molybdenum-iron cluster-binding protein [Bacteroidales bacterium]